MRTSPTPKDLSWLFWFCLAGAALLVLCSNLRPPTFSGSTALEVAQSAREVMREEVKLAILPVGDPETSDQQIAARWREIAANNDVSAPIVKSAQKSCAARTWAVDMRPGSVNGAPVWVVICGWPALRGDSACFCSYCDPTKWEPKNPRNTEVVVISDDVAARLLAHIGREPRRE